MLAGRSARKTYARPNPLPLPSSYRATPMRNGLCGHAQPFSVAHIGSGVMAPPCEPLSTSTHPVVSPGNIILCRGFRARVINHSSVDAATNSESCRASGAGGGIKAAPGAASGNGKAGINAGSGSAGMPPTELSGGANSRSH